MAHRATAAGSRGSPGALDSEPGRRLPSGSYRPGRCNIGPEEIARRRRGAIAATLLTVGAYVVLVVLTGHGGSAERALRLLVALPAAGAIVSWLQVRLRFCVRFGSLGLANFGPLGRVTRIEDRDARQADRRRAAAMIVAGLAGGLLIGLLALAVP